MCPVVIPQQSCKLFRAFESLLPKILDYLTRLRMTDNVSYEFNSSISQIQVGLLELAEGKKNSDNEVWQFLYKRIIVLFKNAEQASSVECSNKDYLALKSIIFYLLCQNGIAEQRFQKLKTEFNQAKALYVKLHLRTHLVHNHRRLRKAIKKSELRLEKQKSITIKEVPKFIPKYATNISYVTLHKEDLALVSQPWINQAQPINFAITDANHTLCLCIVRALNQQYFSKKYDILFATKNKLGSIPPSTTSEIQQEKIVFDGVKRNLDDLLVIINAAMSRLEQEFSTKDPENLEELQKKAVTFLKNKTSITYETVTQDVLLSGETDLSMLEDLQNGADLSRLPEPYMLESLERMLKSMWPASDAIKWFNLLKNIILDQVYSVEEAVKGLITAHLHDNFLDATLTRMILKQIYSELTSDENHIDAAKLCKSNFTQLINDHFNLQRSLESTEAKLDQITRLEAAISSLQLVNAQQEPLSAEFCNESNRKLFSNYLQSVKLYQTLIKQIKSNNQAITELVQLQEQNKSLYEFFNKLTLETISESKKFSYLTIRSRFAPLKNIPTWLNEKYARTHDEAYALSSRLYKVKLMAKKADKLTGRIEFYRKETNIILSYHHRLTLLESDAQSASDSYFVILKSTAELINQKAESSSTKIDGSETLLTSLVEKEEEILLYYNSSLTLLKELQFKLCQHYFEKYFQSDIQSRLTELNTRLTNVKEMLSNNRDNDSAVIATLDQSIGFYKKYYQYYDELNNLDNTSYETLIKIQATLNFLDKSIFTYTSEIHKSLLLPSKTDKTVTHFVSEFLRPLINFFKWLLGMNQPKLRSLAQTMFDPRKSPARTMIEASHRPVILRT